MDSESNGNHALFIFVDVKNKISIFSLMIDVLILIIKKLENYG